MRKRLVLLSIALAVSLLGLRAEEPVVGQKNIGEWACGPCSIYNTLALGNPAMAAAASRLPGATAEERVRAIIAKYGSRPSEAYLGHRPRFLPDKGMATKDLAAALNEVMADFRLPPVQADFLNVLPGESADGHLRRVHDRLAASLAAGFPPVVEFRSFSAQPKAESKDGYLWEGLCAHYVVVAAVGEVSTVGFSLRLADPYNGRLIDAFVYAERHRAFTATKDFTLDAEGKPKWEWISGYPYLLVLLPQIPLKIQKEPWHNRTTVTLAYAAYRSGP